jgi:ribosomal protein L29
MAEKQELTLQEQLTAKRAELVDAKKRLRSNELANPHAIKHIKKDIARILTKITQEKQAKEGK